ncbi:hypothetical protein P7C71_g6495, partial [Lecanoromycetidae sp. Uapishka_2]
MSGPPPSAYLYSQLIYSPPYPTKKYTGQTILITGSNVGLGLESARHFVRLDAKKVILAVRDTAKGEAAKESILKSEKKTADVVEVWKLDLSNYQSVKENARKAQSLDRLDILVENAGMVTFNWRMMEDNESSITTNVVSPMLHAILLLPKLRETAVKFGTLPRLVFVGSFVHWMTSFPERNEDHVFEALADEKKANMADRYNLSKLLEMYEVQELAELTRKSPKEGEVVINFTNPGWVVTEAMREWTGLKQLVFKFARFFLARSTEVGARTTVNAAEGGMETHGQYMNDCQPGQRAPLLISEEGQQVQKKVWAELAAKLERIQPGIMQNI